MTDNNTQLSGAVPWWRYWLRANRHRFEPFFESDGPCWCNRGRRHRVHGGTKDLLDTDLGRRAFPHESPRRRG